MLARAGRTVVSSPRFWPFRRVSSKPIRSGLPAAAARLRERFLALITLVGADSNARPDRRASLPAQMQLRANRHGSYDPLPERAQRRASS